MFFNQAWSLARPVRRIPSGGPVCGQQQGCFGAAVVKGPLQGRKVFQHLGLHAVGRPDPVRCLVDPPDGEDSEPGAGFIPGTLSERSEALIILGVEPRPGY